LILVLFLVNLAAPLAVSADENSRRFPVSSTTMADHWSLARWDNGQSVCELYLKQSAEKKSPTPTEILDLCGKNVYQDWMSTVVCEDALKGNPAACKGLFLRYMGSKQALVQEYYEVPPASVKVEVANCLPWELCDWRPELKFTGGEPLDGYHITSTHARIGTQERSCDGAACTLRMPVTDTAVQLEYWAVSSYGDESPHKFLWLRNRVPTGQQERFLLEVLDAGLSRKMPAGAAEWGLFPALSSPMAPLIEQPASAAELATAHSYLLLAGSLLRNGKVDGSSCPAGGLLPNGNATPCGQELSQAKVLEWQNQYDTQIFDAAQASQVPARLLKGIIARETQFWPVTGSPYELGLGRLTENGADLLLSWNVVYFLATCQPVYGQAGCSAGYSQLSAEQRKLLRGLALSVVGTPSEIGLVAATLKASSQQVAQMMFNVTGQAVPSVTSLEDMWSLSVANYHAGSGCIGGAMQAAAATHQPMTWNQIAQNLEPACQVAVDYVNQVAALGQ
jgi:hypothetical protein